VLDSSNFRRKKELKHYFRSWYQKLAIEGGQFPTLLEILNEELNDLNFKKTLLVESEGWVSWDKISLIKPVSDICRNCYVNFNGKYFK